MAVAGTLTYKTNIDQSGIQKGMQKTGSIIKGVIAGLGIAKAVSKAMNVIRDSTDGAIDRLDTLNNFPKVMSNLGISADKSSKSIKKMSDKLTGLPTTLDQGAMAVQRFTSANGDVEKSTDIFLALNNAILAGGASTEIQASALEQLSQAYSKGKPDMMEWRTAMTAMPAQLKQVAKAMGYVSADKLGEALRKGEVSMDEFMDKVVELNEKGVDGLANFEEQARNSVSGIKTSLTVAKTQVVKGVADIIKALDVKLDKLGLGSLSEIIKNIGVNAKKSLDFVAELISGDTEEIIKKIATKMETEGPSIIEKFGEGISKKIPEIASVFGKMIKGIFKVTNENMPSIIKSAGKIIESILKSIKENLPSIMKSGTKIITTLAKGISDELPTLIPLAVDTILTYLSALLENMPQIVQAGFTLIMSLVQGIINALPLITQQAPQIISKGADLIVFLIEGLLSALPKLIAQVPHIIAQLVLALTDPKMLLKLASVGPRLILALVKALIENIPNLLLAVPKIITELYRGFRDRIKNTNWLELGKKIIEKIWEGIKNTIDWFIGLVKGWFKAVKERLQEHVKVRFKGIGKNILTGIWNGIKGGIGAFNEKIAGFVGGIAKTMAKKLKIGSPSKVMADEIGQWIPKGISVGIEANIDSVTGSLDDMYKEMNQAIKLENGKMNLNTVSGDVYNKTFFQTPISIDLNAEVEMESQKVGRLVTPSVVKTIKTGGGTL